MIPQCCLGKRAVKLRHRRHLGLRPLSSRRRSAVVLVRRLQLQPASLLTQPVWGRCHLEGFLRQSRRAVTCWALVSSVVFLQDGPLASIISCSGAATPSVVETCTSGHVCPLGWSCEESMSSWAKRSTSICRVSSRASSKGGRETPKGGVGGRPDFFRRALDAERVSGSGPPRFLLGGRAPTTEARASGQ